jgi:hypothetical protein
MFLKFNLAYPDLLGTKGYVVVVVVPEIQFIMKPPKIISH